MEGTKDGHVLKTSLELCQAVSDLLLAHGWESLPSFPFSTSYTHTLSLEHTHSKTHPLWRFSCRASTASSQMIPPTHETAQTCLCYDVKVCVSECVRANEPVPVRKYSQSECVCLCSERVFCEWWGNILTHVFLCFLSVCCSLRWRWVEHFLLYYPLFFFFPFYL